MVHLGRGWGILQPRQSRARTPRGPSRMDLQPIHPNTPIRQHNRPCPQHRRVAIPRTNSRGTPVIPARAIILVLKDQAGRDGRGGSRALLSPRKALSPHDKRSYPSTQDHGDTTQFFIVQVTSSWIWAVLSGCGVRWWNDDVASLGLLLGIFSSCTLQLLLIGIALRSSAQFPHECFLWSVQVHSDTKNTRKWKR